MGLPVGYGGASFDDLIGAMRVDKKTRGSVLRFLVLNALASPQILAGPDEDVLRKAFETVSTGTEVPTAEVPAAGFQDAGFPGVGGADQ